MGIVFILLPLTLLLALGALAAFFWAVRKGQFEDIETPAVRILFDEVGSSSPRDLGVLSSKSGNKEEYKQ
jgi:cbb3-type cytochrome oxidase maturation protein